MAEITASREDVGMYINGQMVPVLPSAIRVKHPTEKNTYNVLGIGEIDILHGEKLDEIDVELLLPWGHPYYQAEDSGEPADWVEMLRGFVDNSEPLHFIYVGMAWDINMQASLHDLAYEEEGGDFSVVSGFKLRKYVPLTAQFFERKSEERPQTGQTTKNEQQQSPAQTYTVKSGDTLSHIAKSLLGDSSRWREIYELNKDTIKNPNLIRGGQVLKLPSDVTGLVPQRISSSSKKSSKSSNTAKSGGSTVTGLGGASNTVGAILPEVQRAYTATTYNGVNQTSETYGRSSGGRSGRSRNARGFGGSSGAAERG